MYAARSAEEANESKQGNLSFSHVELVHGCFVFGNDAQRNANKGTEHPDERPPPPPTLLDTKNVLTRLLTLQTVSLYLTRAMGPLSSNNVISQHFKNTYTELLGPIFLKLFQLKSGMLLWGTPVDMLTFHCKGQFPKEPSFRSLFYPPPPPP